MGIYKVQPQDRYIYDIILLDGNAQVYTAYCPTLSKIIDASYMYSVTTSGEAKRSSHKLNQTHTWQDPGEKRIKSCGQCSSTSDSPQQKDKQQSESSVPELEGRRREERRGEARMPECRSGPAERAGREHRRSRHPVPRWGGSAGRRPHPRSAESRIGQPGTAGHDSLRSAGPAAGNCGQRPERRQCRPGGPASQRRFRGGSHGSPQERARAGSRGRACAALPSSRSPPFPPCPVAARALPAPPLVPRTQAGTPRRPRADPATWAPSRLPRARPGGSRRRPRRDGRWLDGGMDGGRTGAGAAPGRLRTAPSGGRWCSACTPARAPAGGGGAPGPGRHVTLEWRRVGRRGGGKVARVRAAGAAARPRRAGSRPALGSRCL